MQALHQIIGTEPLNGVPHVPKQWYMQMLLNHAMVGLIGGGVPDHHHIEQETQLTLVSARIDQRQSIVLSAIPQTVLYDHTRFPAECVRRCRIHTGTQQKKRQQQR